jgi:hypothetical protein
MRAFARDGPEVVETNEKTLPSLVNNAIINVPDDVLIGIGVCEFGIDLQRALTIAEDWALTDIARQLYAMGADTSDTVLENARVVNRIRDGNGNLWAVMELKLDKPLTVNASPAAGNPADAGNTAPANDNSIEGALLRAGNAVMEKLTPKSRIAIVTVTTRDEEISEFIAGELESIMVGKGFTLIDRNQLDAIRKEQSLQFSGEVNEEQAVSIGKIAGADVIITGAVTGSGDLRRLRLRALGTETGQVLASPSEKY